LSKTIEFTDEEISVLSRFITSFSTKNLDMEVFNMAKKKIKDSEDEI